MTNALLSSISRFWLEVNAGAWRYLPQPIQRRLTTAYSVLGREVRSNLREMSDADFGRGWREGHEVGRLAGWAQRDGLAQQELALKNDQMQALIIVVESLRTRLEAFERSSADAAAELAAQLRDINQSQSRQPVH
jgi:hypothetical protein